MTYTSNEGKLNVVILKVKALVFGYPLDPVEMIHECGLTTESRK